MRNGLAILSAEAERMVNQNLANPGRILSQLFPQLHGLASGRILTE